VTDQRERRIYQMETMTGRCYDIEAVDRQEAFAIHESKYPGEVVIDSKDKTAKRAHERARADQREED
jgi:hypothetical protein